MKKEEGTKNKKTKRLLQYRLLSLRLCGINAGTFFDQAKAVSLSISYARSGNDH